MCITSSGPKTVLKEDLMSRPIVSAIKDRDKSENPHDEVCDLFVDCLLLGNLPCGVSHIRRKKPVLT